MNEDIAAAALLGASLLSQTGLLAPKAEFQYDPLPPEKPKRVRDRASRRKPKPRRIR